MSDLRGEMESIQEGQCFYGLGFLSHLKQVHSFLPNILPMKLRVQIEFSLARTEYVASCITFGFVPKNSDLRTSKPNTFFLVGYFTTLSVP
jgi:hypothetical protein